MNRDVEKGDEMEMEMEMVGGVKGFEEKCLQG